MEKHLEEATFPPDMEERCSFLQNVILTFLLYHGSPLILYKDKQIITILLLKRYYIITLLYKVKMSWCKENSVVVFGLTVGDENVWRKFILEICYFFCMFEDGQMVMASDLIKHKTLYIRWI